MLTLTADNYYSKEANIDYMSASQFKAFRKCEAAAVAELRGEIQHPETTALLVGSYVDASFSGELFDFIRDHNVCKRDGSLKAEFQQAEDIVVRLKADRLCDLLLSGEHQTIETGYIAGVPFKAKFDSLLSEKQVREICREFPEMSKLFPMGANAMIADLKCMRSFEPVWDSEDRMRISFIEHWGYDIQGAIYQELDGRLAPFVLVCATKESEPDIEVIHIPDSDLKAKLEEVEELAPRYQAIKRGLVNPVPCGTCDYCRRNKKLTGAKHYKFFGGI